MISGRKRVLLADDDLEMRRLVRHVLEALGVDVREASSGVALLSCLAEESDFDLVVTDVRMPWISGAQVVEMARAAGFEFPVLIMTAFADDRLRQSVRGMAGALLLEKPFEMQQLVAHTRQILGIDSPSGLS
jgi:two-component system response regulator MprA